MEMPIRRALEDQRRKGSVRGWWRVRMGPLWMGRVWVAGEERTLQTVGVAWRKVR